VTAVNVWTFTADVLNTDYYQLIRADLIEIVIGQIQAYLEMQEKQRSQN
jgi:hypothetical protein